MKCELCKCISLVKEAKRNPSKSIWISIHKKFDMIQKKAATPTFCTEHRNPFRLTSDFSYIRAFVEEVISIMERVKKA